MKTITEFAAITLKNAAKTRDELTTAGKTAEELPAALGEALKLEGDKLTHLLAGLEMVGTRSNDLKRVVVFTLAEGEKAPAGQPQQKGEHWYMAEYYPSLEKPKQHGGPRDGKGRDAKRGGGRGGKGGRGGRPGRDGERSTSGDRGGPGGPGGAGGAGRRPPRGPSRPPQPLSAGPAKPVSLPKPKQV